MSEAQKLLTILRQTADPDAVDAIEHLIHDAPDHELNRINVLAFAAKHHLDEESTIAAFLHAARLGLFELSWNVLCPGCGGVMDAGASLKSLKKEEYSCALCAAGYEPTLDEMVEVTFTVSPRVRKIAAHEPDKLPMPEYLRQIFWSSGVDLPEDFEKQLEEVMLDSVELPPGERVILSLQLPPAFVIVFDPVTHATQFVEVKGEPTRERQNLSLILTEQPAENDTVELRPGPVRLLLENHTKRRTLPAVWLANDALHHLMEHRRPFLTAKRLLTNQTFRDLYRTETLDIDQRLKITSLTFLFTDLKGSTELYERVGDLVAYDLVREHFRVLNEIVASEAGAVVKTIGDAVMATFPTPDHAVSAALRMREAMRTLNEQRGHEDLLLKIGIHEGPCLAVVLNERQDYFGQTVNIASRVQNLANSRSIYATGTVIENPEALEIIETQGLHPTLQKTTLRGINNEFSVYEIP
ncbi:adenylate/guanylate cyclase domain-containing protein [Microvirga sp. KLBC 81]|uniref:adenylate/guanylate cyclase domain-containing protein n=1 Tax=Microvirga sp. KLBC 81 TaxID=1862707 RepID=UPI000D50CD2D|nr:adenylate/guanylate cyclase domain-containing protein [Microvirga sp. KLBC 81]PVE25179.1 adenylate/guanylate cyclase domain-containing protein [Microvirga sp. KLBC 81]